MAAMWVENKIRKRPQATLVQGIVANELDAAKTPCHINLDLVLTVTVGTLTLL